MTKTQLFHCDCLKKIVELKDSSIDLIVTSPPYNLGIAYNTYVDLDGRDSFLDWCEEWTGEVARVMKDGSSFFLNIGAAPSNPLLPYQLITRLTHSNSKAPLSLQNTFHWVKSISIETRQGETISSGHFKPINSKRFVNDCHEFVFHLTKTNNVPLDRKAVGVPYVYKSNIARWGHSEGEDKRCRGNTWFIPYDTINKRAKDRPHPATFPIKLAQRCIQIHGGKEKVKKMLDPFVGIGSSAIAAQREGIEHFIGYDLDKDYLEIAEERISQELENDLLL